MNDNYNRPINAPSKLLRNANNYGLSFGYGAIILEVF
jgi:hypothetical protein